ncbi:hypothetical protein BHE74_00008565 [Ensete ventricosum]|nr:hypothetical protein BHE74_00008565 [Ensete ventricosum]RZR92287.1 hypothetical protein BHM03_00020558 [Ensete ventricosum]
MLSSALAKSIGLRNDGRLDDRSYWVSLVTSLPISLAIPLVYPRMIPIHNLTAKLVLEQFDNDVSKKLNDIVNEIRKQRCSYLRLRLCRKGDPSGQL